MSETNAVLREFRSVVTKLELSNTQSCQFLTVSGSDLHLRSWIFSRWQERYPKYERRRWDFYEEFTAWHFATNQLCMPRNPECWASPEQTDMQLPRLGYVTRIPGKSWRGESSKTNGEGLQWNDANVYSRNLLAFAFGLLDSLRQKTRRFSLLLQHSSDLGVVSVCHTVEAGRGYAVLSGALKLFCWVIMRFSPGRWNCFAESCWLRREFPIKEQIHSLV